ncbi:cell envelope biogenesis protein AsmA [Microvirga aerophila]|uniref:Cell envelope biogenesis protein AsmA n=2 Tax=Microvirga aerophila TaxID=670291 RepID=A0A512BV29_9HYPH|nr:cell envelope biogenesis protein AsmA [Microvirga aerophila]
MESSNCGAGLLPRPTSTTAGKARSKVSIRFMSRRVVFLIALIALAVLGAAAAPWTLSGSGLSRSVAEHLKYHYGLDLEVRGRSTFAILPTPRVKFEDVNLAFPRETAKVKGGILRGELHLLPLFIGRIELKEITLSDTRIETSQEAFRSQDWAKLLVDPAAASPATRLILTSSSLTMVDVDDASLDKVNALVQWSGPGTPLSIAGSASWHGETITIEQASFRPDLLASEQLSPVSLVLSAPTGWLALTGEAQLGRDARITGDSQIHATSVRNFTRWSGIKLPLGSLVQALSIKGDVSLNRRRVTWPSVAVTLGTDQLEGTMAIRLDGERPVITGTLAAESLDLSNFFRPFSQARVASGAWSEEGIELDPVTGKDLDLRLSATTAHLGRVRVENMAASVLVRPGSIEASIGRADLHQGTLKGRLSVATREGVAEFRSQGTFDGVDMAAFLGFMGEARWITGRAQGQFLLEGTGETPAEMMRRAQGRSTITIQEGELIGLALDDALRRLEKRPLLASLNWRGGRTPFDQAQAQILVKNGVGEIADARLASPSLLTTLAGQVSLVDRTLNLKADVSAPAQNPSPSILFDVNGGWDNVTVTPDARSLIQRSGAAKPLFGPDRLPQSSLQPIVNAQ